MPEGTDAKAVTDSSPFVMPTAEDATTSAAPIAVDHDADNDDAAVDAALQAAVAGKGREAAEKAYAEQTPAGKAVSAKQTPADDEADAPAKGPTPDADDAQPPQVDDETRQLLQRYKIRESILTKLPPEEAAEFVANLKERHDAQAQLYAANQQMQAALQARPPQQQAQAKTGQAPATPVVAHPIDPNDPYAQLDALFAPLMDEGQSAAAPLKQAVQAAITPILERAQAAEMQVAQFWQHQEQVDQAAGLEAVKTSDVNLDQRTAEGKANQTNLMSAARRLLGAARQEAGWTPYKYGWKEAISEAFPTTFKAQTKLAQRREASKAAAQAARGGSDPGGQPSRSKPADSEDAINDRILAAMKNGATRDELMLIGAGKG